MHAARLSEADQPTTEGSDGQVKSSKRDKAGGTLDKVRGRLKEAGGALSGNEESKQRGRNRQVKGSARKKKGHLRDLLRK